VSLKNIVICLLIANFGYFAYSQGWLKPIIGSDAGQREPGRVSKQVNPNAIGVALIAAPEPAAAITEATPSAPPTPVLSPPPPTTLASSPSTCASKREQWVVYMGPYASKALADKKQAELSGLGLSSSFVSKPTLKVGLSLGDFANEAAARVALTQFSTQGVKTATVVLWAITDCPPN
jgi:cell division protein FtsN